MLDRGRCARNPTPVYREANPFEARQLVLMEGQMQVAEKLCRACGEEISPDAQPCPKCGNESPHGKPIAEPSVWGQVQMAFVVLLIATVAFTVFAC